MFNNFKHIICNAGLAGMLCALPLAGASAASVAINNPSFESSWTGWTRVGSVAISGDAYVGTKSAKITASSGVVSQVVSVAANTSYTFTAYVLGGGKVGAKVGLINYSKSVTANGSWQLVTITFNSGMATSVTLSAAYSGSEGRFDEFKLDSGTAASSSVAASVTPSSSSSSSSVSSLATSSSAAVSSVPATGGIVYPADVGGGLSLWKLTLPISASGVGTSAQEIKQPALATYSSTYFALNSDKTAMVMTDIFGGARTSSGTAYARSELREMTASGTSAAWSCTDVVRKMTVRQRITKSPTHKPEMSIGQIHDSKNDNLEIRYIGPKDSSSVGTGNGLTDIGRIEAHWNNDTSYDILDSAYKIGDMMNVVISTDGSGYQTVSYTNERTGVTSTKTQAFSGVIGSCYFKAGNYHQACTVTDIYGGTNDTCAAKGWTSGRYETDPWGTSVLEIYGLSLD